MITHSLAQVAEHGVGQTTEGLIWAAAIGAGASVIVALVAAIFGYLGKRDTNRMEERLHGDHENVSETLRQISEDLGAVKFLSKQNHDRLRENSEKLDRHLDDHHEWDGIDRRDKGDRS